MATHEPTRLQRLLKLGALAALAVAVLVWPIYFGIKSTAVTYQQIAPVDPAALAANRYLYSEDPTGKDADIVAIYGLAIDGPTDYVLVDEALVIHPEEKPSLALLRRPATGQPLQVAGLFSRLAYLSVGAFLAALVLGALRWLLVRRHRKTMANVN